MAIKMMTDKVCSYIPADEKGKDNPTTIFYKPLTKAQFDEHTDSLVELKKGRIISRGAEATKALYRKVLCPNEKGIIIANVLDASDKLVDITEKEKAVEFLLSMTDLDTASEIESVLRGSSLFTEKESKN